jgi:hypothetical protein
MIHGIHVTKGARLGGTEAVSMIYVHCVDFHDMSIMESGLETDIS